MPQSAPENPVPAILEYTPYRKRDHSAVRDESTHPFIASHGYACVRVDLRGSGDSQGFLKDEYLQQEFDDGCDVIEWLASQPWCDGNVGMIGISWGGFNALQIAAMSPPSLKAVITICSTDDRYADDIHYRGGIPLTDNLTWSAQVMGYCSRPPDPLLHTDWEEIWLERLDNLPFLAHNWLKHQRRDSYWKHGSVCEDFSQINAAVYAVGGWFDLYSSAIPRMSKGLSCPRKGLIGPWVHRYPHVAYPAPAIDFLKESLRWWDYWLKDQQTGIMDEPRFHVYMMDSIRPAADYESIDGGWIEFNDWPDGSESLRLYANTDHSLSETALGQDTLSVSSPQDTGSTSGRLCPGMRLNLENATDQRSDDAASLVFETSPLAADLEIVGAPEFHIELTVDRPEGHLVVRLCDVHEDGEVTRISYGVVNLCHTDNQESLARIIPGEIIQKNVRLDDIAYRFRAGHRIRIAISDAYWPLVWPSRQAVTLTITTGNSYLLLPQHSAASYNAGAFTPPGISTELRAKEITSPTSERVLIRDVGKNEVVLQTRDDYGRKLINSCSMELASQVIDEYRIQPDDPLTASVTSQWKHEMARGDWHISTTSKQSMHCDSEYYYLEAEIVACINALEVFRKSWVERVSRDS